MTKPPPKKRVSKHEWLACALEVFARDGEPGVRIEALARQLGIAKAGFYWHFENREQLLKELLAYWSHEYTEVIAGNPKVRSLPADQRLLAALELIYEHRLAGMDVHFQAWAQRDPAVNRKVREVTRTRLSFFRDIFLELGFEEQDAEMRSRLTLGYEANERLLFRFRSDREAREMRRRRCALLLAPAP